MSNFTLQGISITTDLLLDSGHLALVPTPIFKHVETVINENLDTELGDALVRQFVLTRINGESPVTFNGTEHIIINLIKFKDMRIILKAALGKEGYEKLRACDYDIVPLESKRIND